MPGFMRRVVRGVAPIGVGAMLLVAGCRSDQVGPSDVPALQNAADLIDMIEDVSVRIVPVLPQSASREPLSRALGKLSAAVGKAGRDGRFRAEVRATVAEVRHVVARYLLETLYEPGAVADLDVVTLALDVVGAALDNQAASTSKSSG